MLKLFTPDYYIESYDALCLERLKKNHINLLVCDIDNTLIPHDVALPDERALRFLKRVEDFGLQVVLISNNVEERVSIFAKDLHLPYYPFAKKPLTQTYKRMLKERGCNPKEVAVLGDQLLTDILGGNRMGFYTILTAPVAQRDLSFTKINRIIEQMVFSCLKRTNRLTKGEFDDKNM